MQVGQAGYKFERGVPEAVDLAVAGPLLPNFGTPLSFVDPLGSITITATAFCTVAGMRAVQVTYDVAATAPPGEIGRAHV